MRNWKRLAGWAACAIGPGLILAGEARAQQPRLLRGQIDQHEQALSSARASHNVREEASELNTLANLYREAGDPQKGLDYCSQALGIETSRGQQAQSKNVEGRILTDMGQEQKAMDLFSEILPVWRELHIAQGEASTLTNMGRVYNDLGQHDKAIEVENEALPLWRQVSNQAGEASALDSLGRAYADMGQGQKALDFLSQALPLWKDANQLGGEAQTLNNTGRAWWDLGELEKALDAYKAALPLWHELGHPEGEAATLSLMGRVDDDLSQKQAALDDYGQALPLWQKAGNRSGVALDLFDSGRIYIETGEIRKALDQFQQALAIWREVQDRRGQAAALTMMGRAELDLGDQDKALDFDLLSLAAWREVGDIRGQGFALSSIGWVYSHEGKLEMAVPEKLAALELAKQASDPDLEGGIETGLMLDLRSQKRLEEAIFFGTEAVNHYQQMRRDIRGLDAAAQVQFVESKAQTYRILAELLVQTNRLGDAERVLDLLKEEEFHEVVLGVAAPETRAAPLTLTAGEQQAEKDLMERGQAAGLADLNAQYAVLAAKATRTGEENAQLKSLETKIEAANGEVSEFFRKTLYPELAQKGGTAEANAVVSEERSEVSRLQNTLADLGPGAIGIRLLVGEQQAYALVVTAQSRRKYDLKGTVTELAQKTEQVRNELRTPASDPKADLAALYAMVVAPLEPELAALEKGQQSGQAKDGERAPTLLWSLDGTLRYLPMAALYDGHRYLAERFNNVLFTPESYGHMGAPASGSALRVLAMGLSKSYGGLPALPGVLPELEAVVRDPAAPESHGPIEGVLLPNDQFTYTALRQQLGGGSGFPVVHIASHFVVETGKGTEPYLMMGGESAGDPQGFALTLSRLQDSTVTFHGTRLLTLSACSTAKGDVATDGLEMDSLGMVAQQKDAEAVLATLWDVNDASTSRLMGDFYSRWVAHPEMGKAEALREAQLAFLHGPGGEANGRSGGTEHRGLAAAGGAAAAGTGNYAHPYYWAPFVLMGNYQ
jgi:CHAT domain-containing protein/tetratricopeptide (TPR) repeat protein